MEEININEIVKVESIGVIKQQLDEVEKIIDDRTKDIPKILKQLEKMSDEEKEEKKGEIKKYKTYLNSIKTQLEDKRKDIHKEIEKPYNEFNDYYSNGVKVKLEESINKLNNVINDIENKQKQEKKEELELFAKEYFNVNQIEDIVCFDDIGLNINITDSMKSLKEQIIAFCEKISSDLKLIEVEKYKDEILIEYKNNLDFTKSKLDVIARHKQLEELQNKKQVQDSIKQEEQKMVKKVEWALFELNENTGKYELIKEITPPKEIFDDEQVLKVTFTIETTKSNIVELKNWLKERGIKYE